LKLGHNTRKRNIEWTTYPDNIKQHYGGGGGGGDDHDDKLNMWKRMTDVII
jgi:hypothetical protein